MRSKLLFYILTIVTLSACTTYQKVVKKGSINDKYTMAKKLYNKKDFVRAMPLFEELLSVFSGRQEREEIFLSYAYCHYGMNDYITAAYYFKTFAETYALNPKKQEAHYMNAVCTYYQSLPADLDQTATLKAIEKFQLFINKYPTSEFVAESNNRIDELRARVLSKAYNNALLYYNIGNYKSAMVSCRNAIDDYPDIMNREELEFLIVKSAYNYAKQSAAKKKEERYKKVITEYNNYLQDYNTTSAYYKQVLRLKEKAEKGIKDINITKK